METDFLLKADNLKCPVCLGFFDGPIVYCVDCKNRFCEKCAEESQKKNEKCPLCQNEFKFKKDIIFENIFKTSYYICKKCNKNIEIDNYETHIQNCRKCIVCDEYFLIQEFEQHILIKPHIDYLIIKFNTLTCNNELNDDIKNEIKNLKMRLNFDKKNKENIIKRREIENNYKGKILYNTREPHKYLNMIELKNKISKEDFVKIKDNNIEKYITYKTYIIKNLNSENKLDPIMDLYFCYKNTNDLNCNCCLEKICRPGNCICKNCMKINQKYHNLEDNELINKAGRVCKYSQKKFHCYCRYYKKLNNGFKKNFICQNEICDACSDLNKIINYYLSNDTINELKFFMKKYKHN